MSPRREGIFFDNEDLRYSGFRADLARKKTSFRKPHQHNPWRYSFLIGQSRRGLTPFVLIELPFSLCALPFTVKEEPYHVSEGRRTGRVYFVFRHRT
jgi:hypothetical protein